MLEAALRHFVDLSIPNQGLQSGQAARGSTPRALARMARGCVPSVSVLLLLACVAGEFRFWALFRSCRALRRKKTCSSSSTVPAKSSQKVEPGHTSSQNIVDNKHNVLQYNRAKFQFHQLCQQLCQRQIHVGGYLVVLGSMTTMMSTAGHSHTRPKLGELGHIRPTQHIEYHVSSTLKTHPRHANNETQGCAAPAHTPSLTPHSNPPPTHPQSHNSRHLHPKLRCTFSTLQSHTLLVLQVCSLPSSPRQQKMPHAWLSPKP